MQQKWTKPRKRSNSTHSPLFNRKLFMHFMIVSFFFVFFLYFCLLFGCTAIGGPIGISQSVKVKHKSVTRNDVKNAFGQSADKRKLNVCSAILHTRLAPANSIRLYAICRCCFDHCRICEFVPNDGGLFCAHMSVCVSRLWKLIR